MNITTIPHSRAESWLQRVGIIVAKSWDRTLVALLCTRTKTRRLSFFLSILTFAYLLGIVFDLFVPFGRTVETQNVLQRWFWRLRGVWPIFVTCRSSLDMSSEFGRVLQGFFFFCNCRFDGCVFNLISLFINIYLFLFIDGLSFALLFLSPGSKCTYCSCEFRALDPIKSLTLPNIWIP
jgi:hypothetical protein